MTMTLPAPLPALIAPKNGLSYVRGATDIALSEATVGEFLLTTARRHPERPAVVFREQGIRWNWREFAREIDAFAAGLLALGIVRGDRVGIWSPNRAEWLLTQFATARIGAILVNINPAYRLAELEYALNKVDCKAMVIARQFKTSMYLRMMQELAPELASAPPGEWRAARLPGLCAVICMSDANETRNAADTKNVVNDTSNQVTNDTKTVSKDVVDVEKETNSVTKSTVDTPAASGVLAFSDVVGKGRAWLDVHGEQALDAIGATLDAHDPINIQFTSGTTGNPKGATLTHRNVVNNARFIALAMRLSEADSLCIPVPLYHCFGMVLSVLACVSVGAAMVFPGEAFEPRATLAAVAEERCTALHGVPTMFIAELDHPEFASFDLSRLRTGIMAGSPCPIETMKRVVSSMHLDEITIAYGMTETSPVSFQSATTDPLDKRTTTVGRVQPHLEVQIVDETNSIVPIGQTGELCTRGYSVMRGYWGDDAKTQEAIVDGWMHSGDQATLDEEGYCNIVGRLKDMLIRGGENIYPREIEEFLFRHPKVQSVQVFGVPDARFGEEVCAWIVLRPGEVADADEIRAFCQGQIAHYKIPRYIRFVDELPMTVTGKVQKFVMRAQMLDELNVSEQKTA